MNKDKVEQLARDLRKTPTHSPRDTLGGFVIAARMLDKARADLLGINGEYNFYLCGLGAYFWKFTGLDAMKFKEFVAAGRATKRLIAGFEKTQRRRMEARSSNGTTKCVACASAISLRKSRNISKPTSRNSAIQQAK